MQIVYLDQNKWIDLARARQDPERDPDIHALIAPLDRAVRRGALAIPLTMSNIYETHKINDPRRRRDLAYIQAILSQGLVFRARRARLTEEFGAILRQAAGLAPAVLPPRWFLSGVFLEAVADLGEGLVIPEAMLSAIQARPADMLFSYLADTPEDTRLEGVHRYTAGSQALCEAIETRRAQHRDEPVSMRRKIYSVLQAVDEIDLLRRVAASAGYAWTSTSDMDQVLFRRVIREAPALHVEREITLRLEAQDRAISHNDLRDMQAFATVVPYAELVVAENQFSSLARQAGRHQADIDFDQRLEARRWPAGFEWRSAAAATHMRRRKHPVDVRRPGLMDQFPGSAGSAAHEASATCAAPFAAVETGLV
ncbi:MAG TPA: hypothetical protein VFE10_15765 [Phenylobacterium sp.]|jgi:hypothetical protein|nr:hypothetical protein [Phenylobacterium sp.]